MRRKRRLAYFVSPHGFGHAARAAAVMEALHSMDETAEFDIFTSVPSWFFETSLTKSFHYQFLVTDVGFVQNTPLKADLVETLARLNRFYPLETSMISNLASLLLERQCAMVICDIAPMGILASKHAGLRSVLVENFTWDWLYEEYLSEEAGFEKVILPLKKLFGLADFHVQTEPVCLPGKAQLTTRPASRKPRLNPQEVKIRLGIPKDAKVVMITMGGIPESYPFLQNMGTLRDVYFVLPGSGDKLQVRGNQVCLPHRSEFFHPDLVNASDALIGKVGYSTLAETYFAGIPFGYIARKHFRESGVLTSFVRESMRGLPIEEKDFYPGTFLSSVPRLLSMPRMERPGPNGAEQAARFILDVLS
jgi:hypothetical protein